MNTSRILNYIVSEKYNAERRRNVFQDWDAKARSNPECQWQEAAVPKPEVGS